MWTHITDMFVIMDLYFLSWGGIRYEKRNNDTILSK